MKYTLNSGDESSRCELVDKDINMASFISDFKANLFYKYARHSHKSQWLDQQFWMCKETFPIGTIISIVDFAENYTLLPQNETQSQYYNSIQIVIFVHITYRHPLVVWKIIERLLENTIFTWVMIHLTFTSLCNIIFRIILISYMTMTFLWIDISFGQIIAQVISRMLAYLLVV